jgi:hypothetical protein
MIIRTTKGVKEALALTPVIRELRLRRPDLRICVETESPEVFENNDQIDHVGEFVQFFEGETYINVDAMSEKCHIVDLTARAVLGDSRIMNRHYDVNLTTAEMARGIQIVAGMTNVVAVCLNGDLEDDMDGGLIDEITGWGYEAVFLDELELPLRESLAVIRLSELYVGIDNDVSYMAMCSDVPMVMHYTKDDPDMTIPFRRGVPFMALKGEVLASDFTDAVAEVTAE